MPNTQPDYDTTAQTLIPCTCGGYGKDNRRHMMDCPRYAIAWEDVRDALKDAYEQGKQSHEKP